jgi:hypothetical protein
MIWNARGPFSRRSEIRSEIDLLDREGRPCGLAQAKGRGRGAKIKQSEQAISSGKDAVEPFTLNMLLNQISAAWRRTINLMFKFIRQHTRNLRWRGRLGIYLFPLRSAWPQARNFGPGA